MTRAFEKVCGHCGEVFSRDRRSTWAYWEKAKYCGQACAGLANRARWATKRVGKAEKFSEWVDRSGDCWVWTGAKDGDGYGVFNYGRKTYRAPRVALELDGRPVPDGTMAFHHCDNPACVRPTHLYIGTPQQNVDDMMRRGRARPGFARRAS